MKNHKSPEVVQLSPKELEELFSRLENNTLTNNDKQIIKGIFRFSIWLQKKYDAGKLSIHNLKRILFGFQSEKRGEKTRKDKEEKDEPEAEKAEDAQEASRCDEKAESGLSTNASCSSNVIEFSPADILLPEQGGDLRKGHGRLGAVAYPGAERVVVAHQTLKRGDTCPQECGGWLYATSPGVFIRITGQSFGKITNYQLEKLRCSSCGAVVTADLPDGIKREKYDPMFKSILVVQKYFGGVPFYRQQAIQQLQHFPLPDATQWDLVEQVADCVYPAIRELEKIAADAQIIHNDDTPVRIVDVMVANKRDPLRERTGMFTTGIIAKSGPREIALYYSGTQHAGENLGDILKKRNQDLPPIMHMCDALAANLPPEFKTILFHCLLHGRRKFIDVETFFPEECAFVIDLLGKVYFYDEQTKKHGLSADSRLAYHKKHSGPLMVELKVWLDKQIDEKLVEPNGGLGKAITYMRNHWQELTKFLHVAGGPLDNNIVERALKIPIRVRKNSLTHRSCHGASVASILMSLIQTCRLSNVNPLDYLSVLQENKSAVFKHPAQWLPWNYEEMLVRSGIPLGQGIAA